MLHTQRLLTLVKTSLLCESLRSSQAEAEDNNIVSSLSTILAAVAPSASSTAPASKKTDAFQEDLLKLCIRDGTPEQARDAVKVMAAMLTKDNKCDNGKAVIAAFSPLLKALTAPQRLALDNERCVAILSALTELAAAAPLAFEGGGGGSSEGRGVKAVRFALESVVLGKRGPSILANDDDEEEDDEEGAGAKSAKEKAALQKKLVAARIVSAIELLVAHIRSLPKHDGKASALSGDEVSAPAHSKLVFSTLVRILEENGLPPAARDRKICTDAKSRAAIRRAAGVGLIQLCDPAGGRDVFLDVKGWHGLSSVFVDTDVAVREGVVEQLSMMITGQGIFSKSAPSLRFLAYTVLCADADKDSGAAANGNAANVGKRSTGARSAALQCVKQLRNTCENALIQCKAQGARGEALYENQVKPRLMPELSLPFALNLLAFRSETPVVKEDSKSAESNAAYKMLRRRLKWLLEPLIQSLGGERALGVLC